MVEPHVLYLLLGSFLLTELNQLFLYSILCILSLSLNKEQRNTYIEKYNLTFLFFSGETLVWSRRAIRESLHIQRSCWESEQPAETGLVKILDLRTPTWLAWLCLLIHTLLVLNWSWLTPAHFFIPWISCQHIFAFLVLTLLILFTTRCICQLHLPGQHITVCVAQVSFSGSKVSQFLIGWKIFLWIFFSLAFVSEVSEMSAWSYLNFGPSLPYERWLLRWRLLFGLLKTVLTDYDKSKDLNYSTLLMDIFLDATGIRYPFWPYLEGKVHLGASRCWAIYEGVNIYLGTCGLMVIIIGNRHGNPSSNPGQSCLHFL